MLRHDHLESLRIAMTGAIQTVPEVRLVVSMVNQAAEARILDPITREAAVASAVSMADGGGWIRELVDKLRDRYPAVETFKVVLKAIDDQTALSTSTDIRYEVLLDAGRAFVDRTQLRQQVITLLQHDGPAVLMVEGQTGTGKSFSRYLITHIARASGYATHHLDLKDLPTCDLVADEILQLLGSSRELPVLGNGSATRWAERLAMVVQAEVRRDQGRHVFIFDEAGDAQPLPEDTVTFINKLAKYADDELRSNMRVVLMRFSGELPNDIADAAARENVVPFTTDDMVAMMMQVVTARNWAMSEPAMRRKLEEFEGVASLTLRDKQKMLRALLGQLEDAVAKAKAAVP